MQDAAQMRGKNRGSPCGRLLSAQSSKGVKQPEPEAGTATASTTAAYPALLRLPAPVSAVCLHRVPLTWAAASLPVAESSCRREQSEMNDWKSRREEIILTGIFSLSQSFHIMCSVHHHSDRARIVSRVWCGGCQQTHELRTLLLQMIAPANATPLPLGRTQRRSSATQQSWTCNRNTGILLTLNRCCPFTCPSRRRHCIRWV